MRRRGSTAGPCAAASAGAAEAEPSDGERTLGATLVLGCLFLLWYGFNIWYNIYNKQVLNLFPFPITCTNLQFCVGSCVAAVLWTLRLHPLPKSVTKEQVLAIFPLAVVHTLGNVMTNVSLGKVAVSFTHTIKAMEPFFSVVLSSIFLGDTAPWPVLLSLVPIVLGVILASFTEPSFNWAGFFSAIGANITFQSRNVLTKKVVGAKLKGIDSINLFGIITIYSALLCLPVTAIVEGARLMSWEPTAAFQSVGGAAPVIVQKAVIAAICFHGYQQLSFMVLSRVSPVTHSVGNCLKRVVVIVSSIMFFQTPVSPLNLAGTGIALAGVFLYSQVKRRVAAAERQAKS